MKTLTEMRAEIVALNEKIGGIRAQALTENRDANDEEDKFINDCLDQVDKLERNIKTQIGLDKVC